MEKPAHKELLRLMRAATDEQNSWLAGNGNMDKTLTAIEAAADWAPKILKLEWERVKKGEIAFRLVRNYIAPIVLVIALGLIYLLTTGTWVTSSVHEKTSTTTKLPH